MNAALREKCALAPPPLRVALRTLWLLGTLALLSVLASARAVTITEAEHEGRAQFKIVTTSATYFYDRAGGGFSRLIDRDGKDWISFRKEPLKEVPASAAAGFRGIPNSVFGKDNPDAGAGHPGFDQCESAFVRSDTIRTVSKSGRWAWTWRFTESNAVFTMEKAPAEDAWWFLYEGTIGGRWSPRTHYWGTDTGGPRREITDTKRQLFEQWHWAYFGDDQSPRVLLLAQVEQDELPDTLWFMGSTRAGLDAPDGMVVFGFGRGPGGKPQFRGAGQRFALGLVEGAVKGSSAHENITATARHWLRSDGTAMPDANGLTHWLYTPTEKPVAGRTYQLVVGVHGAGGTGKGAGGVAAWATDFDDVIVLGPSFAQPKRDPNAPRPATMPREIFQMSGPAHEAKLAELVARVRQDWNLHPKIFLHGFSAGAQFSHRYAFRHPELVAAVSAHSGGSWAKLDGDDRINPAAKHIPFTISCGEDDRGSGGPPGTPPRIEGARRFTEQLRSLGFAVEFKTWPGIGHKHTPEAKALGRALLENVREKK